MASLVSELASAGNCRFHPDLGMSWCPLLPATDDPSPQPQVTAGPEASQQMLSPPCQVGLHGCPASRCSMRVLGAVPCSSHSPPPSASSMLLPKSCLDVATQRVPPALKHPLVYVPKFPIPFWIVPPYQAPIPNQEGETRMCVPGLSDRPLSSPPSASSRAGRVGFCSFIGRVKLFLSAGIPHASLFSF